MEKRTYRAEVRLTLNEQLSLFQRSKKVNLSVSGFIRKCCLEDSRFVIIDRKSVEEVYHFLNEDQRALHSVLRKAKHNDDIPRSDIDLILERQRELIQTIDKKLSGTAERNEWQPQK